MQVKLNGELKDIKDNINVSELLESLEIIPERVVVELNMTILKRAELTTQMINENDTIEIVQFVGGG